MNFGRLLIARLNHLPPPTSAFIERRDIDVIAGDGIKLKTDLFLPDVEGPHPTLLMRVPYGRAGFDAMAKLYAERGFVTVLQACRGTGGSDGAFDPLTNERVDGLATLDWIKAQSWFDGRLGTTGPSYLGYAQWAICDALPPGAAMAIKVSSAEFRSVVFPSRAFHLQMWLSWVQTIEGLRGQRFGFTFRIMTGGVERRTQKAASHLPLIDADIVATGHQVPFWRHWITDAVKNDKFWKPLDHTGRLGPKTPPCFFVSGWYDFMIDQLLRDYQTLVSHGHTPFLTIGPWTHVHPKLQMEGTHATLAWMKAQLMGDRQHLRQKPVRIHISGLGQWREYDVFPPPDRRQERLFLAPKKLGRTPHLTAEPSTYRYDPNDPTPNLGGAIFAFSGAGARNNARLENRADVLVFTGATLDKPLTLIGQPKLTLFAGSSLKYTDFFARLCDVAPNGRSTNICDGLVRIAPTTHQPDSEGVQHLEIKLHHTAHQFRPGHRLRLQISSGAHPRYARNTGTSEPVASATNLAVAEQMVLHDAAHPSALDLPIFDL